MHLRKWVTTSRIATFSPLPTKDSAKASLRSTLQDLTSKARRVVNTLRFIRASSDTESSALLQRHRLHRNDQKRLSISSSHSDGVLGDVPVAVEERRWKSSARIADFYCISKCVSKSIRGLRQWERNSLRNLERQHLFVLQTLLLLVKSFSPRKYLGVTSAALS